MPAFLNFAAAAGGGVHGGGGGGGTGFDLFRQPRKRSRVTAAPPFFMTLDADCNGMKKAKKLQPQPAAAAAAVRSLDELPDKFLGEVLRRLRNSGERELSAFVSKRWLTLTASLPPAAKKSGLPDLNEVALHDDDDSSDCAEVVARVFNADEATDVRLLAAAVAAAAHGGLTALAVRGGRLTDGALSAVGHGNPELRKLSLSDLPSVTDASLAAIAAGCPMLEELELVRCPRISDDGLKMVGDRCRKLKAVAIKNCPLVGDRGVTAVVHSALSLASIELDGLNSITDVAMAVIGLAGKSVADLSFARLPAVGEKGFWVMAKAGGLRRLRRVQFTACPGITDAAFVSLAKLCPGMTQLTLRKIAGVSDAGLRGFAEAAEDLEGLIVEECGRITLAGLASALLSCGPRLRCLAVVNCAAVRDVAVREFPACRSALRSIFVTGCPGFGDAGLELIGKICPQLESVVLGGLAGVTDRGVISFVSSSRGAIAKASFRGCGKLTDAAVVALVKAHGRTLRTLDFRGCVNITDAGLMAIAAGCPELSVLDMSKSGVSEYGLAMVNSAAQVSVAPPAAAPLPPGERPLPPAILA